MNLTNTDLATIRVALNDRLKVIHNELGKLDHDPSVPIAGDTAQYWHDRHRECLAVIETVEAHMMGGKF